MFINSCNLVVNFSVYNSACSQQTKLLLFIAWFFLSANSKQRWLIKWLLNKLDSTYSYIIDGANMRTCIDKGNSNMHARTQTIQTCTHKAIETCTAQCTCNNTSTKKHWIHFKTELNSCVDLCSCNYLALIWIQSFLQEF